MNNNRLLVTDGIIRGPAVCPNTASISITGLKDWIFRGKFFLNFFRYQRVTFLTYSVSTTSPPFFIIMLLRLLSRDECFIQDASGMSLRVTARLLVEAGWRVIRDLFRVPFLLFRVYSEVKILSGQLEKKPTIKALDLDHRPLYLRTDLCATLLAGGSVTHISGVLNNLDNFVPKPLFLTSDTIPMVRDDIEKHIIRFNEAFWDFPELPLLNFNQSLFSAAESILEGKRLSFIYQRYSHFNYSGVKLSKRYHVPLVLEYNGSEAWVSRHWGSGVIFKRLSAAIELLNLRAADLVVVVSRALKDELISRGILPDKILVNPNGVDTEKYHPAVEGAGVRELYKLKERIVFGFIGTFGKWHGAEVLIEAFGLFLKKHPEYRERVRLLMIGDGVTMSTVKARIKDSQLSDSCILTGIVPQKEGPRYLAACDILVSPHVPNPDGSPFFGSPTKLFEYMAMGKPIIASSLGQIGEVLKHDETAWLVEPKDAASLMNGIKILLEDEDRRRRLGLAARREAESKYTWKQHTGRIINALKSRLEEAKEREEAGVFSPHLNILPHSAAQEIIREA
ncbi:MAG: glycosyltransferase family 4 protein, partial [Candidatus Omnitrophica bacterium]|nr:glycosyltransferase family 4 protein [Candidatus Omnitrophota bacterium]